VLQPESSRAPAAPPARVAGVAIIVSASAALVAVARHPTLARAQSPADVLAQIAALTVADEVVHGVLLVLVGVLFYGFTVFAIRRGLYHGTVLGGLIAYALASAAMIGAALVDGFVVPALGARYAGASSQNAVIAVHMLAAASAVIQVLSKFAIAATGAALVFWSVGLLRAPGAVRVAGFIGIGSATLPVVVLLVKHHLDPHSLGLILSLQTIWYLTIGALLARGDV
jgi:hypothetical protein